jgi:hypothetical protein
MAYSRAHGALRRGAYKGGGMKYTLYFSSAPAPRPLRRAHLEQLIPVEFGTLEDAVHGAALVIRGGQYPWLIEGADTRLEAPEIGRRCEAILALFKGSR